MFCSSRIKSQLLSVPPCICLASQEAKKVKIEIEANLILTCSAFLFYRWGGRGGPDDPISISNGMQTMKKSLWLSLAAGILLVSGCGTKTDVASTEKPASAESGTKMAELPAVASDPKEVVRQFLDSMRQGNAPRLSSLLSSLAREEIKRKQLEIAPLGSPKAVFQVIQAVQDGEGMLVESTWTEPEQDGQPATELEVVWELRKEPAGWRICGMAVDPKNGDEVQIVDFEKLEPEQPAQEPQRVASLPNSPTGFPANAAAPAGNLPSGNFGQSNNYAPNTALPSGNYAPSGNLPPVGSQLPQGNYAPANTAPANNGGYGLPPSNLPTSGLPPSNFPTPSQPNGSPLPAAGYGSSQLPPIVPGNFSLPPAGNSSSTQNDPNRIRR